jgi:phenylalanyl-tRNA synthetase alpha chain
MDLRGLIKRLNIREKKVLLALQELDGEASAARIQRQAELEQVAVMRAALSLKQHGLAQISEETQQIATLTEEGRAYADEGMPERRMLEALFEHGPGRVDLVAKRAGISKKQADISLGWLRRRGWIEFSKEKGVTVLKMSTSGEVAVSRKTQDELLLEKLAKDGSLTVNELSADMGRTLVTLKSRKLVEIKDEVRRTLSLTKKGEEALELGIEVVEEVSQLTHDLLASGEWREVKFRQYNVKAPGTPLYPGKVHPQQRVVDELRTILLEMGFVEIKGFLVESEFWNFDALFQAQDHPAREIHDSLSLSKPARVKLPSKRLVRRVAVAHERGVAGSRGWGYKFDTDVSRRPVMCSQTTATTVRYLARKPKPPVKVFCIDRVYRHDRIDYKHLAEFYQAEGIVMAPRLTLRDMLGYLKQILVKMGVPQVRFRPGYFPFTEPSVEADGYFPEKGEWIELLGAGMFRPEVLQPLGIRYPVLAWGIGFNRIAMIRLGIEDMRDLNNNDREWLSKHPMV